MTNVSRKYVSNRSGRRANGGSVLIVVMWISFGLVSIALYFGQSMLFEYRASSNSMAGYQAEQAIEGAGRYISFLLTNLEEPGTLPDFTEYAYEKVTVGPAAYWLVGRSNEENYSQDAPFFGLGDEASKLNLNTATVEMLEALPNMTPELAAAIVLWREAEAAVESSGPGASDYLALEPAYNLKESSFETVEELRLVIGAEWKLLYGEDFNRNGILDPNEDDGALSYPDDNEDGRLEPGIMEFLTVYSREPNVQADGSPRIDVTGDSDQDAEEILTEAVGAERLGEVLAAFGDVGSVLEFYIRSQMTLDEFALVHDAFSATDDEISEGLINVNTAPVEVLACIPGIGEAFASELVSYRQGQSLDQLLSIAWVAEVLDEESAIQAGPFITTRTYQYTADVAAVGLNGSGFRRVKMIFDTSEDGVRVVHRRDLSRLGWPLGEEIREEYAAADTQ